MLLTVKYLEMQMSVKVQISAGKRILGGVCFRATPDKTLWKTLNSASSTCHEMVRGVHSLPLPNLGKKGNGSDLLGTPTFAFVMFMPFCSCFCEFTNVQKFRNHLG